MTWSRAFDDPIPRPGQKPLRTLQECADYILALPKAEQHEPRWQAAIQTLILVADHGGDTLLPRIAMVRALNGVEPKEVRVRTGPRLIR